MITENKILQALSSIIDPDFQKDIVSLGFIKNVKIIEGHVSFDIELTTPACPIKTEFQNKAQLVVSQLEGVKSVDAHMTSKERTKGSLLQTEGSTLSKVKSVIAVSSCKGGVGKSTIAACIAKELSQRGFKVGLLDADLYGPSLPTLFNIHHAYVVTNEKEHLVPIAVDDLKVMSFGFLLGDAPAVMRGPMVSRYVQQLLHTTDWGELDYLFIDMPPGTGDVQLTITQTIQLSGAIIVTTPQTLSLVDVARGIVMFESVNVPMLGIIENMSFFLCDSCNKKHFIFGDNEREKLEGRFGLETLATLPLLPELTKNLRGDIKNPLIKETVDRVVMAIGKSSIERKDSPQIDFNKKEVILQWPDEEPLRVDNKELRLSCRCALCIDEMTGQDILKAEEIPEDIAVEKVTPLGHYALSIVWTDGHSSGIYPYVTIRKLAKR